MKPRITRPLLVIVLVAALLPFIPTGSHAQAGPTDKFYQLDVVATNGQSGLTDIFVGPSINDQGAVAFVGRTTASAVFVSDRPGVALRNLTPTPNATVFYGGPTQINNSNQVITQQFVSGTSPSQTFLHIRDGNGTNPPVLVAAANGAGSFNDFAAIRPNPSLNNNGQVVFSGQESITFSNIMITGIRPNFNKAALTQPIQPMVADNGNVIVRAGNLATSPIFLYNHNLTAPVSIASSTHFTQLGSRPGVSDDGRVVVFYGNLNAAGATAFSTTAGPGIFASVDEGGATRRVIRITGRDAELGFTTAGAAIGFDAAAYNSEVRVAVSDVEAGPAGIDGNSFVVCFMGGPTAASPDDLFTNQSGLWTVRVNATQRAGALEYKFFGGMPVAQIGDVIGGRTITGLNTYDPIANANTDHVGTARTIRRGDHKVVFWASTNSGNIIVRGTYVDSDEDSLPDHWERSGVTFGGVLNNLPAMGADPQHKDLFIHADWMLPDATYRPQPAALQIIRDAFRAAPVSNPDGTTGINIHVDAGSTSVMNPATGAAWGALSRAGSVTFQSSIITLNAAGTDFVWTDVDNIKVTRFNPAKRAPIFHYALFAHQYNSGNSSGLSRGIEGVDFIVTLGTAPTPGGTAPQQAGTFIHELGHNLGLRHGGTDNVNFKPNYLSLMNYSFQFIGLITAAGTPEWNYSTHLLPPLTENSLNESVGISDPGNHRTIWHDPSNTPRQSGTGGIALPAIDWNWNGAVDPAPVTVDVNADGGLGVLTGFNDWPAVVLDGGGKLGTGAAGTEVAEVPSDSLVEPTIEEIIEAIPEDLRGLWDCSIEEHVTVLPEEGGAPHAVIFDGSASAAPCGTVVDWSWDFGDGTNGSGPVAVHVYTAPGNYIAKLRMTDNNGHTNFVRLDHPVTVTTAAPLQANLAITTTSAPDPGEVNQPLAYTLFVSNSGPDTAVGVTVTDPLPPGVTFNSVSASQGACTGSTVVTCDLGALAATATATVTVFVTPTAPVPLTNTASVTSGTIDPDLTNNSAVSDTTVNNTTDQSPPATAVVLSRQPNSAGWHNADVALTFDATDGGEGSGVQEIIYTAAGAQPLGPITVAGSSASVQLTANGTTILTYQAKDRAGNLEAARSITINLDKVQPTITYHAGDGLWHGDNVQVHCAASDGESGLANASDQSFVLSTDVAAGAETANALTGTRAVCDLAGNCATAGPVEGNRVDRKAPHITIASPTGGTYLMNQIIQVMFECADGGSGLALCQGSSPNGGYLDSILIGPRRFEVNSRDNVNNTSSLFFDYQVSYAVHALYDQTKTHKGGSTIPIKLQLRDANGVNQSAAGVVITALNTSLVSGDASGEPEDAGQANPDSNFRFDPSLGGSGGYIFNLQTTGYATGTYVLYFRAGDDPVIHTVGFKIRV